MLHFIVKLLTQELIDMHTLGSYIHLGHTERTLVSHRGG
jgi:hypothetical protein